MDTIPGCSYTARKLSCFQQNVYRIESAGATTVQPGGVVTIALPDASCIDLRSFALHFTVKSPAAGADTRVELPASWAFISTLEVYCGGQSISTACANYDIASRQHQIAFGTPDGAKTIDSTLANAGDQQFAEVKNVARDVDMVWMPKIGFLASSSTRYWNTGLTGPITLRFTINDSSIIGVDSGSKPDQTFSLENVHATITAVQFGPAYTQMLMDRLDSEEFLPVNYQDVYTFQTAGSSSFTNKFSLSSRSIDYAFASNILPSTAGDAYKLALSTQGVSTKLPPKYYFESRCDGGQATKVGTVNIQYFEGNGKLRSQWLVNNVPHTVFESQTLDLAHELAMVSDRIHAKKPAQANLVDTMTAYNLGLFVAPLNLSCAGCDMYTASGYDSRASNVNMELRMSGLKAEAFTNHISVFATSQLRIGANRQIYIEH